jgi:glycerol-3-phosphate dehydrogenase
LINPFLSRAFHDISFAAASRGLKVAAVDQSDWASGTSGRSTKLIHGGIRYLEKAFMSLG